MLDMLMSYVFVVIYEYKQNKSTVIVFHGITVNGQRTFVTCAEAV